MKSSIDLVRLADWFEGPQGTRLLSQQQALVSHRISRCFGYHQLEFLIGPKLSVGHDSLLGHRITAVSSWQPDLPESTVICRPDELPFGSDSVDLVILHHTLDIARQPHQTLRESARILRAGGHLVVVGFNPWSLWGLRKILDRGRTEPWNLRFLTRSRLLDWLHLLGLEECEDQRAMTSEPFSVFPWQNRFPRLEQLFRKLKLPIDAFHVTVAQKRVSARLQVSRRWRRNRLAGVATVHSFSASKKESAHVLKPFDPFKPDDSR